MVRYIQDKILRKNFKDSNKQYFLLKLLLKNFNIFIFTRINVLIFLRQLKNHHVFMSDRCVISYNKKKFNKFTSFSRMILLKKIYKGEIIGFKKSIW